MRLLPHVYRHRSNYWSNTKFADRIRRTFNVSKKPFAATMEGWDDWKDENKSKFGYWLAEEFLDDLQNVILYPSDLWHEIRVYIRNRFFDKTHLLTTNLKPGEFHEFSTVMEHGLMEGLVDFIEIEKAHMHIISGALKRERALRMREWFLTGKKQEILLDKIKRIPSWRRFTSTRCPEAGIKYLEWEMTLDSPEANKDWPDWQPPAEDVMTQARAAKEQFEIYNWWKEYITRPDEMDISGWTTYCDELEKKTGSIFRHHKETPEERARVKAMLDEMHNIEESRRNEETEMMIRLVKIRKHLWT